MPVMIETDPVTVVRNALSLFVNRQSIMSPSPAHRRHSVGEGSNCSVRRRDFLTCCSVRHGSSASSGECETDSCPTVRPVPFHGTQPETHQQANEPGRGIRRPVFQRQLAGGLDLARTNGNLLRGFCPTRSWPKCQQGEDGARKASRQSLTARSLLRNTEGKSTVSEVVFSRSKHARQNTATFLKLPMSGASLLTVFQLCCLLFLLPVGSAQNLTTPALETFWSSDPIVIPNFVSAAQAPECAPGRSRVGFDPCNTPTCSSEVTFLGGDSSVSSGMPSVACNGTLTLALSGERMGGRASFSVSFLWGSMVNISGNISFVTQSKAMDQTFSISVFVGSVDFNLQADANANLSGSVVAQNLTTYLGVEEQQLQVTDLLSSVNASRRLLGTAISLQASVRVYSASSALSILSSLNSTLLSSLLGAPVSVSGVQATFQDIAGRTALVLSTQTYTARDDAGLVSIPTVVSQILAPAVQIGADGMPAFGLSLRVKQWRQSTSTGPLGAWQQSGEPSSLLLFQASGNCSVCLDGGNVSFSVLEGAGGEVVVEFSALNGSVVSELILIIFPQSAAPSFALAPFPSSIPEDTDFTFSILNISRGGWRLASALPVRFEFGQSNVPTVQNIEFSVNCTNGDAACDAVLKLYPMRFGNTTLTLTMFNDGASYTPYFADNYSVPVDIVVSHENVAPSFVLTTEVFRVEEDAACVLTANAAGSLGTPTCNTTIPRLHRYNSYARVLLGMFEEQTATACPPSAGWTTVPGACLDQTGTFTLVLETGDASIFASEPALSPEGALTFTLEADRSGQATYNVTLTDDGLPLPKSSSQLLTIFVFPINDAPTFSLTAAAATGLTVTEGTGTTSQLVVASFSPGPFETQAVTFSVAAGPGAATMFSSFSMTGVDTRELEFTLQPAAFGVASLFVTARDNGGVARGGVPVSAPQEIVVNVLPVNSPPIFTLPNQMVRVRESQPEEVVIEQFATGISAGNPNEDCAVATVSCQSQQVTFRIDHVEREFLFSRLPSISNTGTLSFTVQPFQSGATRVYVRLQDDAGSSATNTDSSDTLFFDVVVETVEYEPSFALPRAVECLTLDTRTPEECNCPPTTENQFSLRACGQAAPAEVAAVWVLKDAGNVSIEAFATHITNAKDYLHASMTIFTVDNSTGRLRFQEHRRDPVAGTPGLEFSTDLATSSDGSHVYALEYDLDALLIFEKKGEALEFLDRRESVERRLRFVGFNDQDRFDRTPLALASGGMRSLSSIEAAGKQYVLAATGADEPAKDVERRRNRAATPTMVGFPYEPQDLWDATAALWMFSADDAFAPVSTPAADVAARFNVRQSEWPITNAAGIWNRPYTVACAEQGCSFSRGINALDTESCVGGPCTACSEAYPTQLQAASIRDLTGKAGPLVLLGPACKSRASQNVSDWDVADSQMDVRTFMMTNYEVDAMQFDGSLHPGMFLTLDINKVVTGDDITSKLPQGNFAAELWFTIDVDPQDNTVPFADLDLRGLIGSQAYRRFPFCGRGWALGYRNSVVTGTTLEWHLFVEQTRGFTTGEWQMQYSTNTPLEKGVWQHLVAVYEEPMARLYLNGALVREKQACETLPCGRPTYPGSFLRPTACDNKPFNFSVGVFYNGMDEMRGARSGDPVLVHKGAIHMVRLYKAPLDAATVAQQFNAKAAQMARNPLETTYWTVSAQPGREAPQFDFVDMAISSDLVVRGVLDPARTYRCEWTTSIAGEQSASVAQVSLDAVFRTNRIECRTPLWPHGVRVATFRVSEWRNEEWKPVWMKVCLDAACGFPPTTEGRARWFWGTGTTSQDTRLKNNVDALPFRFRFVSASSLLQMDLEQEVGGGAVERVLVQAAGSNYVDGSFVSDIARDGRLLSGRFTVDASGAVVSTAIDSRGMAYPSEGGNVVLLDSVGHRMNKAITRVDLNTTGSGFLSGSWEILGAAGSNARGTFNATQADDSTTGRITDIYITVGGSDYAVDPPESALRFYYTGTQKEQEGSITRVLGGIPGFISGFTTDVPCVANCSNAGCTGDGFLGVCVASGGGFLARVDVTDPGSGYDVNNPPTMFCVMGGGRLVAPGGTSLTPIIPSRPSLTIFRAQGAVVTFETHHRGLQDLSLFGLSRAGLWSDPAARPLWPAAAAFTAFTLDNSTYFLHANWWDGVVGNKFVVSNAGRQMEARESFLYSWNPYTNTLACVQSLATAGSSEWAQFSNSGGDFVAVANYQQVLPDGESTTRAWSRIYRFGNNPNAGSGGGSCGAASPHGFAPIDQSNFTEFETTGATGLETLIMNHTTRQSLVQYLVVSNYYDSETDSTMVPSKLYMLGWPVSATHSRFGISSTVTWKKCSDTGASCSTDSDCFVHTCSDRCIVSRRGNVVDKVCRCSNRANQFCREDSECFSGITCAFGGITIDPEDHSTCFADGKVRFVGTNYDNLVTACEMQSFDVERATDVAYVHYGSRHFLVFASDSEQPTQLWATGDGSEPFVLVSSVQSKFASSASFFYSPLSDHLYLILTQRQDANSLILRWNEESFLLDHTIALAGGQSGLHFIHRGQEYGAFAGSTSSVDGGILLFQAYDDTLPPLDGPNSITISPDGDHVYVASLSSRAILCFLRQPAEGTLALLSETSLATLGPLIVSGVKPRAEFYGSPVRGVLDMVISPDGMNVYLAASQDNAVHTFMRNATSGALQYLSSVTDEDRSKMMQGPRQLVATADGTRVYAACLHSQSVVALDRSPATGALTYRDTMVNGERRVVSLQTEVRPGGGEEFPARLGAEENQRWQDAARAADAFTIDGQRFIAIASSDVDPEAEGIAVVLMWNATSLKYELFQELRAESSASDVEFFEVTNLDGRLYSYLAVANLRGGIGVYVWDAARSMFAMHHAVPAVSLPYNVTSGCSCRCSQPDACGACFGALFTYFPQCPPGQAGCQYTDLVLSPRKLKHFTVAQTGEHFLAVANYNSVGSTCTDVFSMVYRWNGDAPRSSRQGEAVWGYGFEAFQALDTHGALDVDFVAVESAGAATRNMLFVANFAEGGPGSVAMVWEHVPYLYNHLLQARAGRFELRQSIPAQGVSAVHPFRVGDDGYFLAVANRQTAPFTGDIAVYSVSPQLLKWNGTMFELYQTLEFASIPDETSYFPDPPPAPNVSAVPGPPTWTSLSNLAGATSFTYFQDVDGEHYLLVAQSFCDPLTNRSACSSIVSQPQSTILQWDTTEKIFTEMLAWADTLYEEVHGEPVHPEIRRYHQAALRMPMGRALRFAAATVGDEVLLVSSSADKGAVAIRFVFNTAPGFGGAFTLAADSSHRFLYTASEKEQAVAVIELAPSLDSLGNPVSIFEHVQSLSQLPLQGRVDAVPQGLQGVRSVSVEEVDCTGYIVDSGMMGPGSVGGGAIEPQPLAPGTMCTVAVVRGSVPRNQMPCSDHSAQAVTVDPLEPPLECRQYALNTSLVNSSNPNLFAVEPYLVPSGPEIGTLSFTLNPGQSGFARFQAQLSKTPSSVSDFPSATLWSEVLMFDVNVIDINDAPTFVLLDVEFAMDGGVQEAVFATNITAEGLGLANYTWDWEYALNCSDVSSNCTTNGTVRDSYLPAVFARDPVLRFEETQMGLVGIISVEVVPLLHDEVQLFLRLNDGSEPDPRTGASPVSETKVLSALIVPINHAPTFVPNPYQVVMVEGETQVLQNFITQFYNGPPLENRTQLVSYEVGYVEDINVAGWNTTFIFEQFAVTGTTLTLRLNPDFNGEIIVYVRVFDGGGTELGGADSSFVPFALTVIAVNDAPVLEGNGNALFACAMYLEPPQVISWSQAVASRRNAEEQLECDFALGQGASAAPTLCAYSQADNARDQWLLDPASVDPDQDTVDWDQYRMWNPITNGPGTDREGRVTGIPEWYTALSPQDAPGHPRAPGDFAYLTSGRLKWEDDYSVLTQTPGRDVTDFYVERILNATVSFYFVLWGNSAGSLSVSVRYGGTGSWHAIPDVVLVRSDGTEFPPRALPLQGRQPETSNRNDWLQAKFVLNEYRIRGRDVEVRFEAKVGNSVFDSTTIDTISITSDVEVDRSQQVCWLEFNITGVLVDTLREFERAFVVVQPLDEMLVQNISFAVRVLSGAELFFDDPYVLPDGTFVVPLSRAGRGMAQVEVTVIDSEGLNTTYPVRLRVDDFAELPPFTLRPLIEVVDGDGLRAEPLFAVVTSLESLPESARQYIFFTVECTSTAAGMFAQPPAIDSVGTLTWEVRAGFSGRAQCSVILQAQEAGIPDTAPQAFSMRVWPRPQIHSLQPAVLPARKRGAVITVRGRNFGSLRSRGYSAEIYGNISVQVTGGVRGRADAWTPCVTTTYVGDEELLCEVPEGEGQRNVKVEVLDRTNRTGVRAGALVSADMWFVGVAEDEQCASIGMPWPHRQEGITACGSRGFLGFSPVDAGQQGLAETMLNISSSVRSVSVMGGRVYVGGGFASVNGQRVNSIFGWDGKDVLPLQLGLDGSVAAMSAYVDPLGREKLVVAGSFTRAYTTAGAVVTGGVAVWDGASSQWEAAAGVQVHGVAMCLGARGSSVLVGGKFTAVGDVRAQNVAVFNGTAWNALGEGVVGEVYACAMSSAVMYVGGNVGKAGGEEVENVAMWNGKDWGALLDSECLHQKRSVCGINGRVLSMATVGEYLYVGGMFDMAGGKPANNVARFYSGVWEPLGGGVDGPVTVMSSMRVFGSVSGSCVYIAGEFRKATDLTGDTDTGGLARWCVGDPVLVRTVDNRVVSEFWQAVDVPEGVRGIKTMAAHPI